MDRIQPGGFFVTMEVSIFEISFHYFPQQESHLYETG
jgi:hypothetical protein